MASVEDTLVLYELDNYLYIKLSFSCVLGRGPHLQDLSGYHLVKHSSTNFSKSDPGFRMETF